MDRRRLNRVLAIAGAVLAAPLFAPQLLAFPYSTKIGQDHIWSTAPISISTMRNILTDANGRVAESPLAVGSEGRDIFLTDGGWRWLWLANTTKGSFALTRPVNESVIVNQSDLGTGLVTNNTSVGGKRTLASVIAHEKCHGMIRRHFGIATDFVKPQWLREGYCDHVAQKSSLTDQDVAALKAAGKDHPALPYYFGRKRVEANLAANGGNVERLFDEAR